MSSPSQTMATTGELERKSQSFPKKGLSAKSDCDGGE